MELLTEKDIRRLGDPGQVFAGRGGILPLDEHPAANVINLGANIFGVRGVDKIGLKLIEDLMQNSAGVLKQPVVQMVLKMEQIQGVFRGQVIVRVRDLEYAGNLVLKTHLPQVDVKLHILDLLGKTYIVRFFGQRMKEQTEVMERIFGEGSAYTDKTLNELKQVMLVPEQADADVSVYGKTGLGTADGNVVDAWFTGFAESPEGRIYYCVYLVRMDGKDVSSTIAKEIAVRHVDLQVEKRGQLGIGL